jgi:hypothetical protein
VVWCGGVAKQGRLAPEEGAAGGKGGLEGGLEGGDERPTACVVCGKAPDVICKQCGDVYCSSKWMGNPGCFARMHRRGNRKAHSKEPYTYCAERVKQLNQVGVLGERWR